MLGEGLEQYGGDHLAARERHLARREARLERAEASLAAREARQDHGQRAPKNWPPCYPVLRHDIEAEYPPANRPTMRVAHAAWTLAAAGYLLNAVVVTFAFFGAVGASVGDWFLAVAYALAGVPLSRWGWFGSLRDASRRESPGFMQTAAYARFFAHFAVHLLMCAWIVAGLPGVGGSCADIPRAQTAERRVRVRTVRASSRSSTSRVGERDGDQSVGRGRGAAKVQGRRRRLRTEKRRRGRRRRRRVRIGFEFEAMYVCVEA